MNTRLSLVLPGIAEERGRSLTAQIHARVEAQEEMMSRYRSGALAAINARAFGEAVRVPDALWAVLLLCRQHWERTNGLFDIAQGARKDDRSAPGGLDKVIFDERVQTVRFTAPVLLDLGGIGKGLALKEVETILRAEIDRALISFGESSILVLGEHPCGGPWRLGLAEWDGYDVSLINEAMSISGQMPGSEHIIDPEHGGWASGPAVMAVTGPCPVDAEVLSTALFVAGPPARADILSRYRAARFFEVPSLGAPTMKERNVRPTPGP